MQAATTSTRTPNEDQSPRTEKESPEWISITKVSHTDVLDVHDQMPLLREDSLPKSLLVQWNKLCEPLVLTRG